MTPISIVKNTALFLSAAFLLLTAVNCGNMGEDKGEFSTRKIHPRVHHTPSYEKTLEKVEVIRSILKREYRKARAENRADEYFPNIRKAFTGVVTEYIIPYWYGTEWAFYGDTEIPGEGSIACGYFVSTVLRDAGIQLNRVATAQLAAENIILSLTNNNHIRRYRNTPFDDFLDDLKRWGNGLYIVGLDCHVGFILVDDNDSYFIHSSYVDDRVVKKETAKTSAILRQSAYRIIGKISEDKHLLISWLNNQ